MDISINDYISAGIELMKEKFNNRTIDKLFGDSLDYPKEKEVSFSDSDFRGFEKLLIKDAVISLYKLIASNLVVVAIALSRTTLNRPKSIKGYADNIYNFRDSLKKFANEMDRSVQNNEDGKYIIFRTEKNRKGYHQFLEFMNTVIPFFQIASKIEKVCDDKNINDALFLKIACDYNKKVKDIFVSAKSKISDNALIGDEFEQMLEQFITNFERNVKTIEGFNTEVEVKNDVKNPEQTKPAMPKIQISEKEQARLSKISEANDLYERFKIDFMRDLQKEVSLMNRDMYESLMDKIEVFLQKFPMPLSNKVSFGMANEACNQINKFIDVFGEISKNTYSPIVFGA